MTDSSTHPQYQDYQVLDSARTVAIHGIELAKVTTEKPDLLRWTEITLWRYTPKAAPDRDQYLFQVVAKSLVYHAAHTRPDGTVGSRCGKGAATSASTLSGYGAEPGDYDAQPCPDCNPSQIDDLGPEDTVFMERDWPRVETCEDAADVRRKLAEHNPKKGPYAAPGGEPTLNHPSQRLLEQAALIDPAFGADKMIDQL